VQFSFALFFCSMNVEAEQKERDDRVIIHASRVRHNPPKPSSTYCIKVTQVVDPLCALGATLTSNLVGDGIKPRRQREQVIK